MRYAQPETAGRTVQGPVRPTAAGEEELFLSSEGCIMRRKANETYLGADHGCRYSKDRILELYAERGLPRSKRG